VGRSAVTYAATLKQSSPFLVQNPYPSDRVVTFKENRIDNAYLKSKDVRRALMTGTDFATIRDLIYPGGDLLGWPVAKGDPAYTAIADLPTSTSALFTYDA